MTKNYYAILMAGGVGSRFWPLSTTDFPKQFHDILGTGETLIQKTYRRLSQLVPQDHIRILTNERYRPLVIRQLPQISEHQLFLEPAMRNTAPCILYAALKINQENPDAVTIIAPTDHWIEDEAAFKSDVMHCFNACQHNDILMTMGVPPTFPHIGYGYIQHENSAHNTTKKVVTFIEKPEYPIAKKYVAQGNFLWNTGIFIWNTQSIITAFKKLQPTMYALFQKGNTVYNTPSETAFIKAHYAKATSISIDYAIMENAKNVYVRPATFDWNDLGSWGALYDKLSKDSQKNAVVNAAVFAKNASGNMVRTAKDKLVVIDGLKDYIVVDQENALLIYPKAKEQKLKDTLTDLKTFGEYYP